MSILRDYRRSLQKKGWVWRMNEEWLNRTIDEARFLEVYLTGGMEYLMLGDELGDTYGNYARKAIER